MHSLLAILTFALYWYTKAPNARIILKSEQQRREKTWKSGDREIERAGTDTTR